MTKSELKEIIKECLYESGIIEESTSVFQETIKRIVERCKKIVKGKGKEIVLEALEKMIIIIITKFFEYYKQDCEEEFVKNKNIIASHLDIKAINCEPFKTSKGEFIHVHFKVDMDKEFLSNIKDDHIPSVDFDIKIKNNKILSINDEIYFDG